MPRILKKSCYKYKEEKLLKIGNVCMKPSNIPNSHNKKLKATLNNYTLIEAPETMSDIQASTSNSTESIIYVGSYSLNEKYPLIDLTNSYTNISNQKSIVPLRHYPNLLNCRTVYTSITSLVRNRSLTYTSSTSRISDRPKLNLKRNSKSSSCLIVVNDNKHVDKFKTIDISEEAHLLSIKEKSYIDHVTQLKIDDHNIINNSLEIGDDMNLLENCDARMIMSTDDPINKIMQIYNVKPTDEFS